MAFDLIPQVIAEVRPYTMVPDDGLALTIQLTLDAIDAGIPGDLVECGTWMGGCSFAMLLAQRYQYGEIKRPVWMYDSFGGMSPPTPEDGYHARWWWERAQKMTAKGEADPDGTNFVTASLDQVMENIAHFELGEYTNVRAGWLHETLAPAPSFTYTRADQIAVLRVDCDWYDPCMTVYKQLEPLCSVGAPIIIDDYDAWEGCRLATHAYLTLKALPWKIRSMPGAHGAWMTKDEPWVIEHATRVAA